MTLDDVTARDLRHRFNPDGSPLRDIQMKMLDILIETDAICRRHGLRYWLSSGTLIGAARHGGFVPWDDDLDIEMPLADYRRFCDIAVNELPPHLRLHNSTSDPMFRLGFSKVRDIRTTTKVPDDRLSRYFSIDGLFIDVFPVEPSTSRILHIISGKLTYLGIIAVNKRYRRRGGKVTLGTFRLVTACLRGLNRIIQPLHPGNRLRHAFPSTFPKPRFADEIFPLGEIEFEGHRFMAPHDVNAYLSHIYGDWTRLPDLSRIAVHTCL